MGGVINLKERLEVLKGEILACCQKAGRKSTEVRLVPASKGVESDDLRKAYDLGLKVFGENRVQEARVKQPLLPPDIEWHFIGGLQRNKAKEAVRLFALIHSVDSVELARELDRRAGESGKVQRILIEVNMGGEASKHGVEPGMAGPLAEAAWACKNLELSGFMTVAPYEADLEKVRPYFAGLRMLRDEMEAFSGKKLPELSMGMSHDYKAAIEEGATIVRVGTALFGARVAAAP
ncbi:MAG: YggS family pyridoxal phosphate-dependent enzyme [Methylacidiphilales bacterium]|nr:YggS family pyridoxal phosphate-dependent enzyme [Candidatus Methylacidiphilales bacterium]